MKPVLQVALDFVDLARALKLAAEAVKGGADWLEAGTPLIKAEGLEAIRALKKNFPAKTIVADMKTMDVGRVEVEMASKAGASVVGILGAASDETIKESVMAARNYGSRIIVDLIEIKDIVRRAREVEKLGADFVGIHIPIDEQMRGNISFEIVKEVSRSVKIPVSVAGGITSYYAASCVRSGGSIIVVGGAITKSPDARLATLKIKRAITKGIVVKSESYHRIGTAEDIKKVLSKVSAANLSDALHRAAPVKGLMPVYISGKVVGPAFTVRTSPGDWAKPVQAIDAASPGDIIVIDASGAGPAVWGELATTSAIVKKIAGVVIYGGIRDTSDIKKLKFPSFASVVTPQAGEPKGFGEMDVVINIGGVKVAPGDWIIADEDGVMVLPKESAVEFANRAMDVFEREERLRHEIKQGGKSLAEVAELLKWEKK